MINLKKQLKELEQQRELILEQMNVKQANQKFLCGCGKLHKIKDCAALTILDYESPHGCTGGAFWYDSELRVLCPNEELTNRFLFKAHPDYLLRDHYDHNAESQFKRRYLSLFKQHEEIERNKEKRAWCNNYYVDKNHKKFDISIV